MGDTRTVGFTDSFEVISELLEGEAGWMGVGWTGWDTGLFRTRCEMLVTVPGDEEEDTPKPDDFCGAEDEVGPAELEGTDAEEEGPDAEEEGLEDEEEGPGAEERPVDEVPDAEEGPAELESQLALPD